MQSTWYSTFCFSYCVAYMVIQPLCVPIPKMRIKEPHRGTTQACPWEEHTSDTFQMCRLVTNTMDNRGCVGLVLSTGVHL